MRNYILSIVPFRENMADAKIYNVKGDNNLRWAKGFIIIIVKERPIRLVQK